MSERWRGSNRAREQQAIGQLRVSGATDVASVIGDVVGMTQAGRIARGEEMAAGIDHPSVAQTMAQVMGVTPLANGTSPVTHDLARFGVFADQALRMGISGQQAEQMVREVKTSPDGQLGEGTRTLLIEHVRADQNLSWDAANAEVNRLEYSARILPNEITAIGQMSVPIVVDVTVNPGNTHIHPDKANE